MTTALTPSSCTATRRPPTSAACATPSTPAAAQGPTDRRRTRRQRQVLFDTKTPLAGGSGRQFDWRVLDAYHGTTSFLLSGGIGPDDTGRLAAFHHPRCIGIDLNSRFELEPGLKDIGKLKTFIKKIREL